MGFFDLSGTLGRQFGSIGIALSEINTRLNIRISDSLDITGPSAQRAQLCLQQFCDTLGLSDNLKVCIESAIPEHVGLGSGTQMSLAIGAALNALYDLKLSVRELAAVTERGQRSGIGIGTFEQGGLVVDGGRGEKTITPPLLVRMDVPADWQFILVFDRRGQGLHGTQEIQAFSDLPPFPALEAARLCHLLLMRGLPAIVEQDLANFGDVISELQSAVGNHFAPAQGGVFTSAEVGLAMQWLAKQGAVAIGQTSWGPTGFCAVEGIERSKQLFDRLKRQFCKFEQLDFVMTGARNSGATVLVDQSSV